MVQDECEAAIAKLGDRVRRRRSANVS